MWSLIVALLLACSSPPPSGPNAPAARTGKVAKQKGGKGKAKKAKTKAPPPIGVTGPATGVLTLEKVASAPVPAPPTPGDPAAPAPADPAAPAPADPAAPAPADPAAPAPTPADPAADPAAPAPADPAAPTRTEAKVLLTFADGTTAPVKLGTVDGTCVEKTPEPIGPEGMQQTPLWAVTCTDAAGKPTELAVTQITDQLTVLKAVTSATGSVEYKPIKRVKLASGAVVSKKTP